MVFRALTLLVLALLVFAVPSRSQTPSETSKKEQPAAKKSEKTKPAAPAQANDPVVARVNGTAIYRSDIEFLRSMLPPVDQQELAQMPPEQSYSRLVNQQIGLELAVQAARKERVDELPRVKRMLALDEMNVLQGAYFDSIAAKEITDAKLKERYDQYVKANTGLEEVHVLQIVVANESEAKDVIDQLKKGADFRRLATAKTIDPEGVRTGGDLGFHTKAEMAGIPGIADAVFALKSGEFTQTPIQSGPYWHVVKVEDRRTRTPASYADVERQLKGAMASELAIARLNELGRAAKVEVFNPDGSKLEPRPAPPLASAPAPAAAAAPPTDPAPGQPALLPLQNGNPSAPPPVTGPPTMAPATQDLGK